MASEFPAMFWVSDEPFLRLVRIIASGSPGMFWISEESLLRLGPIVESETCVV